MRDSAHPVRVIGIVPAAGRSGRMGMPKQFLHVDGKPMLLGVIDALLAGGVGRVIVVATSTIRAKLLPLAPHVEVVLNDDPRTEMIDSIRMGLASSPAADGYLVCPSDAARLAAADARRCIDAFAASPDHVVIATHGGRRGHPMIFPAALVDAVRSAECDGGLNQLSRLHPQRVREVACDSPATVANVNTPADYENLTDS